MIQVNSSQKTLGTHALLKAAAILIMAAVVLPAVRFGVSFKLDLPVLLVASLLLLEERKIGRLPVIIQLKIVGLLIFLCMVISNNLGNVLLDELHRLLVFPTEFMQVFSRIMVFYIFLYIGYKGIIHPKRFDQIVSTIFMMALIWGMLQAVNVEIVKSVSSTIYALTDLQRNVLESARMRVFGTAGNAITWGGLSALMFFYFYFLHKRHHLIKIAGIFLAIINILFSSSRAALFAFLIVLVLMQFIIPFFQQRGPKLIVTLLKRVIITTGLTISAIAAAIVLVPERIGMILLRVENTQDDLTESGRGAQMNYFLDLFADNKEYYVFGIGKPTLDKLGFMEIEPFFLVFAYGIVGLLLHYTLLAILLGSATKMRKYSLKYYYFIIAATLFYIIFSLGFFFFREIISGLPFWWLCGYLIGLMYKMKHCRLQLD